MKNTPSSILLISTYNWLEALALILDSVKQQSQMPDEVIIADDGSTKETKKYIDAIQDTFPTKIRHFWQEDKGFRKSRILNLAIAKTMADYIIQIDGDCILHKHFIKDHLDSAEQNAYLFGSRVSIQASLLPKIFEHRISTFGFFAAGIKKRTRNIHLPILRNSYKPSPEFSKKIRGCNLSYWRKDFISINGYNENIEGWGREDSEMALRLNNANVFGKRIRYGGIVYHIYHQEESKIRLEENDKIQQRSHKDKITWCKNGIDQYL